jgi:protein involved in polysaccharide export with SLBB domain
MKLKTSRRRWGLRISEGTHFFIPYQKGRSGFAPAVHFIAANSSVSLVLVTLTILALADYPSRAQQDFRSTSSASSAPSGIGLASKAPTQGEYAVRWAQKLGLGENLPEQEAIHALAEVGVEPQAGWQQSNEITTDFLTELFDLTLEAAQKGLVAFRPDEFITQGGYAVQLVQKLGLSKEPTIPSSEQDAIIVLGTLGIKPEAGWQPNSKVDADFLTDVLSSTVDAAKKGVISASPEQAYRIVTSLSDELQIVRRVTPSEKIKPEARLPGLEKRFVPSEQSRIERLLSGRPPFIVSTKLKQFGYDIFEEPLSTFAPVTDVPVGPDYVIGPGDNFTVTLWGRVNATYTVTVDRNGEITLPELGVLNVSSMTFTQLQDYLRDQLSRKFTDFKMSVTMGKLRTIRVLVVGEVRVAGSYTVSSLSTVINALFASGGPSKNGTLREVRLLRNEQKPVTIDLYDFLLGGNKSKDARLQDGDTIFVPLIGPVVGIAGNVKRPAIYEMCEPMTLAEALDLAGGVTYAGWLQRVQVERVVNHEQRIVADFDISGKTDIGQQEQAADTIIQDGDLIQVFAVSELEQNVVHLEGHVLRPGKYELKSGMRLRDIVSSYDALQPQPNLEHAEIERLVRPDFHPIVIPFVLAKLLDGDESENIKLAPFDTIRVFRWDERIRRTVTVSGMVYQPDEYRLVPDMKVSGLINAAGGLKKNAYLKNAEITRRHISQSGMETDKIEINLEKALADDPLHNIALQDYDHLVVRPIPELEFDRTVTISGEVKFPGTYPIHRAETLGSVIERAGGYSERAYLKGAVFTRESAKDIQRDRMDQLIRKIEETILVDADRAMGGALDEEGVKMQEMRLKAKRDLLSKLRSAKIDGRVVVRLAPLAQFRGSEYDLELEDGDELVIPRTPGVVNVVGEVFNTTALLYEKGKTVRYYLDKVGGLTADADKKQVSVIRADGSVISNAQKNQTKISWDSESNSWLFGSFMNAKLDPGDTIVVPRKMDKFFWLKTTKDMTQILFQAAVAAGVVLAI